MALLGTLFFAALSAIGMVVQVYLIAGVLFGENWLQLHRDLGKLVHLGYLLTFGAALVAAAPRWRWLLWPFVLAVVGSVQAFLAGEYDIPIVGWRLDLAGTDGAWHALHGALVPIVFAVALRIVWQAWAALRGRGAFASHERAAAADRPGPAQPATEVLVVLGGPPLVAVAFLFAAFAASGRASWAYLLFTPAAVLVPVWTVLLLSLALTSDANVADEVAGDVASLRPMRPARSTDLSPKPVTIHTTSVPAQVGAAVAANERRTR
jgi:hypothetical protein